MASAGRAVPPTFRASAFRSIESVSEQTSAHRAPAEQDGGGANHSAREGGVRGELERFREMKADECPRYADQRAGDHAWHRAYDLALEPVGSCKAIEQQAGERADGEDDQKCDGRAEGHVGVLLIVVLERILDRIVRERAAACCPVRISAPGPVLKARLPVPRGRP